MKNVEKCYYDGTPLEKGFATFKRAGREIRQECLKCPKCGEEYFTEEQTRELQEKLKQVRAEVALTQVPGNLLTVPGKILKTISERGEMPVSMIVEEVVNDYENPKVAKAAVSRALRQLEAQGLVKAEVSKDRRVKIYSLA
jgi:DNA-binding MarR family transcriptional regulator